MINESIANKISQLSGFILFLLGCYAIYSAVSALFINSPYYLRPTFSLFLGKKVGRKGLILQQLTKRLTQFHFKEILKAFTNRSA
jgi:hypothetical protein